MARSAKYLSLFILLITVAFTLGSCGEETKKSMDTDTVAFRMEGQLQIVQSETDSVLARLDIEIADTEYETQTGLMYRDSMDPGHGMLFVFDSPALHAFYMKNTEIPLDIIFIDEDLRIATIHANANPLDEGSISSEVPVQYVLEVNAGLSNTWGLQPGDRIRYNKLD